MELRLERSKPTQWNGNGIGTSSAEYRVVGSSNIVVYNKGIGCADWVAQNTENLVFIVKAYGWKKSEVVSQLEKYLNA